MEQPRKLEVKGEIRIPKYLTLILSRVAWYEYKLLYRHIIGTQLTRNKQYSLSEKAKVSFSDFPWDASVYKCVVRCFLPRLLSTPQPAQVMFTIWCQKEKRRRKKLFPSRVFTVNHFPLSKGKKLPSNLIKSDVAIERKKKCESLDTREAKIFQYWSDQSDEEFANHTGT